MAYSPQGHKKLDMTERLILLLKEVCKDGQTGPQLQGSPQRLVAWTSPGRSCPWSPQPSVGSGVRALNPPRPERSAP